jgi:hypothetical protein
MKKKLRANSTAQRPITELARVRGKKQQNKNSRVYVAIAIIIILLKSNSLLCRVKKTKAAVDRSVQFARGLSPWS